MSLICFSVINSMVQREKPGNLFLTKNSIVHSFCQFLKIVQIVFAKSQIAKDSFIMEYKGRMLLREPKGDNSNVFEFIFKRRLVHESNY